MIDKINSDNTNVIVAGINTEPFIDEIKKERKFLNGKRKEIDEIIEYLSSEVINVTKSNDTKFNNYRDRNNKKPSASETMEKIKAYVELQKVTVGIGKDLMLSHEKEFKMKMEGVRLAHTINKNNENNEETSSKMSPTEIKKLIKQIKEK